MKTRVKHCYSIKNLCALLMVQHVTSGSAKYIHRHQRDVQTKNYEHPRFGNSSIRLCAFNQYFDEQEGRCMVIPGGGTAIAINDAPICDTETLRGDPYRSRIYYICRRTKTIVAECEGGKRFENRLKYCAIDTSPGSDEQQNYDLHRSYEHSDLPACEKPGRFPVPPDNCTSFYDCRSNGFRLFRSIHRCPLSTGFDPIIEMCTSEHTCNKEPVSTTRLPINRPEIIALTTNLPKSRPENFVPTMRLPKNQPEIVASTTRLPTNRPEIVVSTTRLPKNQPEIIASTTRLPTNRPEIVASTTRLPTNRLEIVASTTRSPKNRPEIVASTTRLPTNRPEIVASTSSVIIAPPRSVNNVSSVEMTTEKFWLKKSTTSSFLSTGQYDEIKATVHVVSPNSSATKKFTSPMRPTNEIDNIDSVAHNVTESTTKEYQHKGTTAIPLASTNYVNSVDITNLVNTSEHSAINSIQPGYEPTASPSNIINGVLDKTYSADYVTLRSDNAASWRTRDASLSPSTIKMSSNNNDEATTSHPAVDDLPTSKHDEGFIDATITMSPNTNDIATTSDSSIEDLKVSERDDTTTEVTELGMGLKDFYTTESTGYNASQKWFVDTTIGGSSTIGEDTPSRVTTEQGFGTSRSILDRSNQYTIIQATTSSGRLSTDESFTFVDTTETTFIPEQKTMMDYDITLTTSANNYDLLNEETSWTNLPSSTNTGSDKTGTIDSISITSTSPTPRNGDKEAVTIQESLSTIEEVSTTSGRYDNIVSLVSTSMPIKEESTTDRMTLAMSTTEPEFISESTVEAYSGTIWEGRSTDDDNTVSQFSTDMPINEESTTDRPKLAMSTTEPEFISESTDEAHTGTTREDRSTAIRKGNTVRPFSTYMPVNEESTTDRPKLAMSTTEPEFISESTDEAHSITDLFTAIERRQDTADENADLKFTDIRTSTMSIAQNTENSGREFHVTGLTDSMITTSTTTESNQDGDRQDQAPKTISSALSISKQSTTVDASADSTNSLSTEMPFSHSSLGPFFRLSTDDTSKETEGASTVEV